MTIRMHRLGLDLQYLPTTLSLNRKIRKQKRAEKKIKKEQMRAAANDAENAGISDNVAEGINNVGGNSMPVKLNLFAKAEKTDKLKFYACYYMTNKNAKLIKFDEKEMELINGIAELANFGKIYEAAGTADLRKYDPTSELYNEGHLFFLNIDDILLQLNTSEMQKKIETRKAQMGKEVDNMEEVYDSSIDFLNGEEIHPISFSINPGAYQASKVDINITEDDKKKYDKLLSNYFATSKHRYEKLTTGMLAVYQEDPAGIESSLLMDIDGMIMGGDQPSVLANTMIDKRQDNIMVPLNYENQDLVKGLFANPWLIVPPDDVEVINSRYFKDMNVYRFIDMNHTGFIKNLSTDERNILSGKLDAIINQFYAQNQAPCRMRFDSFTSPQAFSLVSDGDCMSPLSPMNATEIVIYEGLKLTVEGNKVFQDFKGAKSEYTIPV